MHRAKPAILAYRRMRTAAAIVLAVMISLSAEAGQGEARAVIERLNTALVDVLRNAETLGYRGRAEALAPVLRDSYDLALMARVAVGRHWKGLDAGQRRDLVDAFSRLTVATYAFRFDGYSGQRFEVLSQSPVGKADRMVRSRILSPGDEPVILGYLMRRNRDGWRIVDVFLKERYSELAVRRAEFSGVIRRQGFAALIAAIETKTRKMGVP